RLTPLIDAGVLGGFASPTQFLPARVTQESRRASLPTAETLRTHLAQALTGLPLSAARLEPFVQDIGRPLTAALLSEVDHQTSPLGLAFDPLLVRSPPGWSALLPLPARSSGDLSPQAVAAVRSAVASVAVQAELLDLKGEADRLYSTYL